MIRNSQNHRQNLPYSTFRQHLLLLVAALLLAVPTRWSIPTAQAQTDICAGPYEDVSEPLTELGNNIYIRMDGQNTGVTGGLYPNGSNVRPPAHEAAGLALASQITPLNVNGNPDAANGRIVMLSIGMSNTESEFHTFISRARNDPAINPHLTLINGAQASRTSEQWVDINAPPWQEVNNRLGGRGLTPAQVQVAWIKLTQTRGGDFPAKAQALQSDLEAIARNLHIRFPNLKVAYFSSRTRAYVYWRGLSPEPNAFETGFSVKWMIEAQIEGAPQLNFDPARGEVVAPFLAWGPYLWINGIVPRADGRVWPPEMLTSDCTHPSLSGRELVADMMMEFFKSDSTAVRWFLASPPPPITPTSTPTATQTATRTVTTTPSVTRTVTRTATATPTATRTPTRTVTSTPIATQTVTRTATATLTATRTPTRTVTPTRTATRKATPTRRPTRTPISTGTPTTVVPSFDMFLPSVSSASGFLEPMVAGSGALSPLQAHLLT